MKKEGTEKAQMDKKLHSNCEEGIRIDEVRDRGSSTQPKSMLGTVATSSCKQTQAFASSRWNKR